MIMGFSRVVGFNLNDKHIENKMHFGNKNISQIDIDCLIKNPVSVVSNCFAYKWVLFNKIALRYDNKYGVTTEAYINEHGNKMGVLCVPESEFRKRKVKVRNLCLSTDLYIILWNYYNSNYSIYDDYVFEKNINCSKNVFGSNVVYLKNITCKEFMQSDCKIYTFSQAA